MRGGLRSWVTLPRGHLPTSGEIVVVTTCRQWCHWVMGPRGWGQGHPTSSSSSSIPSVSHAGNSCCPRGARTLGEASCPLRKGLSSPVSGKAPSAGTVG